MNEIKLDSKDKKTIEQLQLNARQSIAQIAKIQPTGLYTTRYVHMYNSR